MRYYRKKAGTSIRFWVILRRVSVAFMPTTPLSDVAKAALSGKLSEVRGAYQVRAAMREALVPYQVARGEGVPELPWDVRRCK